MRRSRQSRRQILAKQRCYFCKFRCEAISRELGHERVQITAVYLGR